jgi:hypothetical protein
MRHSLRGYWSSGLWSIVVMCMIAGCGYRRAERIAVTQIPRLNGHYERTTADPVLHDPAEAPLPTYSRVRLARPDGTAFSVSSPVDLVILTAERTLVFEHPIHAEIKDDVLEMRGRDGVTKVPLSTIEHTEVYWVDGSRTSIRFAVVAGVIGGVIMAAGYGLAQLAELNPSTGLTDR